ncbi:MAG TPA: ABC transporter substrate-binding protein [Anaerovoracaceae bacterium]|nr:ABC transporter substrate-binding protein [Anaerovoracaceae bacterium]
MAKKLIAIAAILIISISGLTGCEQTTNFLSGGTTEKEKDTVRTDEIYIPIEKIRTLNPITTKDEDAYYVDKLIYESLFSFDNNLELTNVLADSYTYAADGASVTISLKKGIKWQDGEELTAEDVKFTIDAIAGAAVSNSTLYGVNISNVKSTKLDSGDPYRITIFFNNLQNISLSNFTFPIIPAHQFKNADAVKKPDPAFIPIGSGPYRVADYNELSHIILKGNENYHSGTVPANSLNFSIIPQKRDAVNMMDVNNITLTFSKDIDRDTIYANKEVNVVNFPSNEVELIGFNFKNPVLRDAKLRKAIAAAIDTEEIIESAYYRNGIQNDNIYFPDFLGNDSEKTNNLYDIEKAKGLLREAGYFDRNGDGLLENAANQTVNVNILVNSEDASRTAAAQIIKAGLDQLLIRTTITAKDWAGYQADMAAGYFDLYIGGYQIKENYDLRFLLHTNYANPIGYSNIALDTLLDRMESGITKTERQDVYTQIREILNADLPYYCLLYKTYGAIAAPSFRGKFDPTFLDLYQGAEEWYAMLEIPDPAEIETSDQQ